MSCRGMSIKLQCPVPHRSMSTNCLELLLDQPGPRRKTLSIPKLADLTMFMTCARASRTANSKLLSVELVPI